ncbi:MAG: hypothetical protein ACLR6S_01070 [Lacrimispora saccharolytica]
MVSKWHNCNIVTEVAKNENSIDKNATKDYTDITKKRKTTTSKGGTEHEDK